MADVDITRSHRIFPLVGLIAYISVGVIAREGKATYCCETAVGSQLEDPSKYRNKQLKPRKRCGL